MMQIERHRSLIGDDERGTTAETNLEELTITTSNGHDNLLVLEGVVEGF